MRIWSWSLTPAKSHFIAWECNHDKIIVIIYKILKINFVLILKWFLGQFCLLLGHNLKI